MFICFLYIRTAFSELLPVSPGWRGVLCNKSEQGSKRRGLQEVPMTKCLFPGTTLLYLLLFGFSIEENVLR